MKTERYAWIDRTGDDTGFDGVFMGDEACGRLLTSEEILRKLEDVLLTGKKAGVILPYLTPKREEELLRLLDYLPEGTMLVANDVGALSLLRERGHRPILGRLLARQNTDPAIVSFFENQPTRTVYHDGEPARLEHIQPPAALAEHWAGSPLFSDETAAFLLAGEEAMTVCLDWLPQGLPHHIPKRYNVLLQTENILVSILPCDSACDCPKQEIRLGMTRAGIPIYRKRNICYYKRTYCKNASITIPDYVTAFLQIPERRDK